MTVSLAIFRGEVAEGGDFGGEGEGERREGEAEGNEERGAEAASKEAELWEGIIGKLEETRAGTQAGKSGKPSEEAAEEKSKEFTATLRRTSNQYA